MKYVVYGDFASKRVNKFGLMFLHIFVLIKLPNWNLSLFCVRTMIFVYNHVYYWNNRSLLKWFNFFQLISCFTCMLFIQTKLLIFQFYLVSLAFIPMLEHIIRLISCPSLRDSVLFYWGNISFFHSKFCSNNVHGYNFFVLW